MTKPQTRQKGGKRRKKRRPTATSEAVPGQPGKGTGGEEKREPDGYTRALVGATVVLAIAAMLNLLVLGVQWRAMRGSNQLTRESLEATKRALDLTEEGIVLTRAGLAESRRLGEESNVLTRDSVQIASEGLALSRDALRVTERSRLVIESASLDIPPSLFGDTGVYHVGQPPGESVRLRLRLRNGGRIPAEVRQARVALAPSHAILFNADLSGWTTPVPAQRFAGHTIPPSADREITVGFEREGGAWIRAEAWALWGEITYSDDLGGPYRLPFCLTYEPGPQSAAPGTFPLGTCDAETAGKLE